MSKDFSWGVIIAAAFFILLHFFVLKPEPKITETIKTDSLIVVETRTCTLRVTIRDTVRIEKIVPMIVDSVAFMDTTLRTIDTTFARVDTRVETKFDLKERLFGLEISHPLVEFYRDTVFIQKETTIEKTIEIKLSAWDYGRVGVLGAAAGLIAYALVQGL
jgi:hypothetical protein